MTFGVWLTLAGYDAYLCHVAGRRFKRLARIEVKPKYLEHEFAESRFRHMYAFSVLGNSHVTWRRHGRQPALGQLFRPALHGVLPKIVYVVLGHYDADTP